MYGTIKQVEWAQRIKDQWLQNSINVPDIQDAQFYINNRKITGENELNLASQEYEKHIISPFSKKYPRYNRDDAVIALSKMKDFVGVDCETTGLKKQDHIVELAIVEYSTKKVLLDVVIQPPEYDPWSLKNYGEVTYQELASALPFKCYAELVNDTLSQYDMVAYNASFDTKMLNRDMRREKIGVYTPIMRATCAMELFTAWMNSCDHYKLSEACQVMGVNQEKYGKPHRALADILAMLELIDSMKKEINV